VPAAMLVAIPAPTHPRVLRRFPRQMIGIARSKRRYQHFHHRQQQRSHTELPRAGHARHNEYEEQASRPAHELGAGWENCVRNLRRDTRLAHLCVN
jgi:hypothetical protein